MLYFISTLSCHFYLIASFLSWIAHCNYTACNFFPLMEAAWSWTFLYIFMQQCGELLNHNTIHSLIWRPGWQSDYLHQFPMAVDLRLLLFLPTSSARIILVSRDGCVERAWRTAFREQPLMWSSSTAWMLATSGLVEDLKNKDSDKSYTLPGYFITYCCYKILLCSTVNYTFTKL